MRASAALGKWAGLVTGGGPREVHWLEQVHGASVVTVGRPAVGRQRAGRRGSPGSGVPELPVVRSGQGDGLVSADPSVALAVLTADCASIALGSSEGVFGAVHAGWRGLAAGVVSRTVARMRELGALDVVGALGPCIHAECYEFSGPDLDAVCAVVGESARGRTAAGHPALDLPAAVSSVLADSGVRETVGDGACTSCAPGYFSHRGRGDTGRQALVVWSADPAPDRTPAPGDG